jgi:5,10-methenyltetrahydrofolate synthetase
VAQETRQEDSHEGEKEVAALLAGYDAFITYVPLRTEVPFLDYADMPAGATVYEIQPRASLDPHAEAEAAIKAVGEKRAVVLMPGRLFDATGTRHGQGGGWYDRFLAEVPKEWLRIGFCYERQFSETSLKREVWDQAMDAVVVVGNGKVRVHTGSRV